ncbi:hypothetical protein D3C87_1883410 [compost metagenome]
MNYQSGFQFLGGCFFLAVGIWLFVYMIKETKNGYRSEFGNDIKLYVASILGCALIYETFY